MSVLRAVSLTLVALLLDGCAKPVDTREAPPAPSSSATSSASAVTSSAPTAAAPPASASADTAALRRGYGPADMRLDACAKLGDDGVIHGRKCDGVFLIYGPYVKVPANAQVTVTFKLEAPHKVTVFGDIVSDLGRRFHASVLDQPVAAKEKRPVGYRVNFVDDADALEARIGIRGEGPVDFDVSDLIVDVH